MEQRVEANVSRDSLIKDLASIADRNESLEQVN
jgi:hypothetical protein